MTSACRLHLRDAALDLELLADRPERLADAGPDVVVLGLVFLAPEQVVESSSSSASEAPRGLVPATASLSIAAPSAGIASRERPHEGNPFFRLHEEVEAPTRRLLQPLPERGGVDLAREAEIGPAGEHHLVQPALRKAASARSTFGSTRAAGTVRPGDRLGRAAWERRVGREAFDLVQDLLAPSRPAGAPGYRRALPPLRRGVQLEARQHETVGAKRAQPASGPASSGSNRIPPVVACLGVARISSGSRRSRSRPRLEPPPSCRSAAPTAATPLRPRARTSTASGIDRWLQPSERVYPVPRGSSRSTRSA